MGRSSFILYHEYEEHLQSLSDAELGLLLRAIFSYEKERLEPCLKGAVGMAFSFIRFDLDTNRDKYEKKCAVNRANGAKGGRPPKSRRFPEKAVKADNDNDNDSENENENENENISIKDLIQSFSDNQELHRALTAFVELRQHAHKSVTAYGMRCLLDKLCALADDDKGRLAIVNTAVANGWMGFYQLPPGDGDYLPPPKKVNKTEYSAVYDKVLRP
jgi:hypothetical protein